MFCKVLLPHLSIQSSCRSASYPSRIHRHALDSPTKTLYTLRKIVWFEAPQYGHIDRVQLKGLICCSLNGVWHLIFVSPIVRNVWHTWRKGHGGQRPSRCTCCDPPEKIDCALLQWGYIVRLCNVQDKKCCLERNVVCHYVDDPPSWDESDPQEEKIIQQECHDDAV